MINELLNSWERRSHCQNNFGNAVPRRSRWKRPLVKSYLINKNFLIIKPPLLSSTSSSGGPYNSALPAPAALQHGCVGRHLMNRNEMRVSGSDSYALPFLCCRCRIHKEGNGGAAAEVTTVAARRRFRFDDDVTPTTFPSCSSNEELPA